MLIRVQPGVLERLGLLGQQDAVGRQGDVANALDRRQPLDQLRQFRPHQRLAAGQPQLVDAQRRHDADEPLDLLERQDFAPRQEPHILIRHAIKHPD